ncbi:cytochrome P450 89A2-like [Magnolia sinica]|uniref:cytochrome P450 89A2-like n=1 Tax=Magnolia sinica TaxID=86752 RepID=UPI00265A85EF|nr:cytochrome P450 89A2-like [Magnolia sinica]
MEMWLLIFLSISLSIALIFFLSNLFQTPNRKNKKLPPGPPTIPLLGNIIWLTKSLSEIEPVLRELRPKYGPIITLHIGPRPAIFISDHSLAHEALIQKGSIFSDRPPATVPGRIISSNQHNITSAGYGPLWRLLRRNLMSEILHPSRVKSYAPGREWVLELLMKRLRCHADAGEPVRVLESFQYSMFSLLLIMCFGQRLDENDVQNIEDIQRRLLTSTIGFNIFTFLPKLGKFVFRKRWNWLLEMRHEQEQILIPLIRARQDRKGDNQDEKSFVFSYVDSLLDLELPEEGGRKLTEGEMVSLCSEFLNAGTDTTSTSLQWIMANLVMHQDIQSKLAEEIEVVVGKEREMREDDLQKMPYLKAVIMEGLRRHPPGHFVLSHSVSEEVTLDGYVIPKNATVNFTVAEMGLNKEIWEDPMEFRPERFLDGGEAVDITGSREIKMMPFGAGRRICPAHGLAMLHLEYFVANLVREFEWKPKDGEDVDLTEKLEFTVVMKNPLETNIISRRK